MEMTIQWYNEYNYVFSALVDSVVTKNSSSEPELLPILKQTVYLSTINVYKGEVPQQLAISPPYFGSSCSFDFSNQKGNTYIIYGYLENGKINTHFCNGTKKLYTNSELDTLQAFDHQISSWRRELKLLQSLSHIKNEKVNHQYSNTLKQCDGSFVNGLAEGKWVYYNYYGEKTAEGNYVNGIKEGHWIEYEYKAEIIEKYHKRDFILKMHGYSEGNYKDGKKEGEWKKIKH
jgi:hypothetical protein